jgi:hypothetical protein
VQERQAEALENLADLAFLDRVEKGIAKGENGPNKAGNALGRIERYHERRHKKEERLQKRGRA